MDLVLNILQKFICHKPQTTNQQPTNQQTLSLFIQMKILRYNIIHIVIMYSEILTIYIHQCYPNSNIPSFVLCQLCDFSNRYEFGT